MGSKDGKIVDASVGKIVGSNVGKIVGRDAGEISILGGNDGDTDDIGDAVGSAAGD